MKRLLNFLTVAVAAVSIWSSCGDAVRTSLMPQITGKEGEVLVVIRKADWDNNLGTIIRDSLSQEYPYLPQIEPMFDVSNVSHEGFNHMFQSHRNILIINIDKNITEKGIKYKKDSWAAPQCVIRINAPTSEDAEEIFKENCKNIIPFIDKMEKERVISNTRKYEEHSIAPKVKKLIGGSPRFPRGYHIKKVTNDFIWVSHDIRFAQQNILVYKYPRVEGMDMMAPENIKAATQTILMENVPGMFENTYMRITPILEPQVVYKKPYENHFAEMRGLWEVHGDYMGGPFISHTFYSPDGKNMITVLGFAYAPKYNKRTYIRQLEAILLTFEWNK